jgi:hypothetical protein
MSCLFKPLSISARSDAYNTTAFVCWRLLLFSRFFTLKKRKAVSGRGISREMVAEIPKRILCAAPVAHHHDASTASKHSASRGKLGMRTMSHFVDALENGVDQPRKTVTILCKK